MTYNILFGTDIDNWYPLTKFGTMSTVSGTKTNFNFNYFSHEILAGELHLKLKWVGSKQTDQKLPASIGAGSAAGSSVAIGADFAVDPLYADQVSNRYCFTFTLSNRS